MDETSCGFTAVDMRAGLVRGRVGDSTEGAEATIQHVCSIDVSEQVVDGRTNRYLPIGAVGYTDEAVDIS